jgi:manganese transport protein
MEGFTKMRMRAWVRRLVTRLLAVVPAVITVALAGDDGVDMLLILSQVGVQYMISTLVTDIRGGTGGACRHHRGRGGR